MFDARVAQPDVTLILDADGVIQQATSSSGMAGEGLDSWRGRRLADTIGAPTGPEARNLIDSCSRDGGSSYVQIMQRFPSGRDVAMEYTTVPRGKKLGYVAIGKNIQSVSELQSRLVSAQQAREQDYWKLRDVETRYRLLFDSSAEAVLLLRLPDLRIVEANIAAGALFGFASGAAFAPDLPERDRAAFDTVIARVRENGRAPGIVIHLGAARAPLRLRASAMNSESGAFVLLQAASLAAPAETAAPRVWSFEGVAQRVPDGFVVTDADGRIRRANRAFLDLVGIEAEETVAGEALSRFIGEPGADAAFILDHVQKHGAVRLLATRLTGAAGEDLAVEISAAADSSANAGAVGVLIRDVTRRLGVDAAAPDMDAPGDASLQELLRASIEAIERKGIRAALTRAGGNRTVAADLLGLSRQSLHTKLKRYGFDRLMPAVNGAPRATPKAA